MNRNHAWSERRLMRDRTATFNWRRSVTCIAAVTLTLAAACDRTAQQAIGDSGGTRTVPGAANDSLRPKVGTGWESEAGPFLVLPTVDGGQDAGSLIRPEASDLTVGDTVGLMTSADSRRLELFSRGGLVGEAALSVEKAGGLDSGCTAWPIARLGGMARSTLAPGSGVVTPGSVPASNNARHWTAAFVKGRITSVPLDSIEGLSSKDSAKLAVNIARLASALNDDTVATFRGLPFVVLRAYRGKVGAQSFVVTTLVRRVNQEDSPKEERLVMVIDGDQETPETWTVGWHERAAGREDELVVSEPLLAFQLGSAPRAHLLFGRDDGESLSAAMLVRDGSTWRVLWESALAGCDR